MQTHIETDVEVLEETVETEVRKLVVFNDEVNTFDWVIDTLIKVCDHTHEQAEQCTLIIHFKGKCSVKEGEFDSLVAMRNEICHRGISAEIC
jgi:ATP-dependent Clp protease adaptor protein ClpS